MTKRGAFVVAQDMLCAFARDIPIFGLQLYRAAVDYH
jgi:hypothetical protein